MVGRCDADQVPSERDARLDAIESKLDRIIAMLAPVHSHAEWVDGLRARLHGLGLVSNTPRIGADQGSTTREEAPRF